MKIMSKYYDLPDHIKKSIKILNKKADKYGHKIRSSDYSYTITLPYDFVKPLIDTKLINYSYYKDGEFTVDGIDYCYKCGVKLDHEGHDVGSGYDPEWRCREFNNE